MYTCLHLPVQAELLHSLVNNCELIFFVLVQQFIKKIKRADRKGSESVTEEKFALLFSTEITITGCDTPYRIQVRPVTLFLYIRLL